MCLDIIGISNRAIKTNQLSILYAFVQCAAVEVVSFVFLICRDGRGIGGDEKGTSSDEYFDSSSSGGLCFLFIAPTRVQ